MRTRAIVFGYEGGLVDLAGTRLEALEAVLADEGMELSAAVLEACPFGAPYEEWLGRVIALLRGESDAALAARLMARAAVGYRSLLNERGPAWLPGAVEFVRRAAGAGLDLGAVSRLSRAEVTEALAGARLDGLFKVLVAAEDLDEAGSGRAVYRLALARMNTERPLPERLIHPHEVAAIEGSTEAVRAAAATGLVTIAIGGAVEPGAADVRVAGFAELDLSRLDSG